ncbi:MAG: NAD(P)H-dependent oxidoreductase, partial [Bradymonadaceae bacterium]
MAKAVAEGASGVADSEVRLRRIPEIEAAEEAISGMDAYDAAQQQMDELPDVTIDDLRWADGIVWGTPTRFGNTAAQVKQFIDQLGPPLAEPRTGRQTDRRVHQHQHQESTILTSLVPLL